MSASTIDPNTDISDWYNVARPKERLHPLSVYRMRRFLRFQNTHRPHFRNTYIVQTRTIDTKRGINVRQQRSVQCRFQPIATKAIKAVAKSSSLDRPRSPRFPPSSRHVLALFPLFPALVFPSASDTLVGRALFIFLSPISSCSVRL